MKDFTTKLLIRFRSWSSKLNRDKKKDKRWNSSLAHFNLIIDAGAQRRAKLKRDATLTNSIKT